MFYSVAIFVACERTYLCEFGENFGGEAAITPTCISEPSRRLLRFVSLKSSVFHPLLIRIDCQTLVHCKPMRARSVFQLQPFIAFERIFISCST